MPVHQPKELGSMPSKISLAPLPTAGESGAEGWSCSFTPHAGPRGSSAFVPSNPRHCEAVLILPGGGCSPSSVHPSVPLRAPGNCRWRRFLSTPWVLARCPEGEPASPRLLHHRGAGITVLVTVGKRVIGGLGRERMGKKPQRCGASMCTVEKAMACGKEDAHEEQRRGVCLVRK